MEVVALAGGVGAGKFLRGLSRVVDGARLTVIVNVADDLVRHGLRICPDVDSVTYWLADAADRERGWGRRDETFRAMEEMRRIDPALGWFSLGDLDLGTHLARSQLLAEGLGLAEVTDRIARSMGVGARILPATEDPLTTVVTVDDEGRRRDLHFQEYWVGRGARDAVLGIRYAGAADARPGPGVLSAIDDADAVVVCPSNPVASIGPILAIRGVRAAVAARRPHVVGVSGIIAGAPLGGMADRLLPAVGAAVTAAGAASCYEGLLGGWVVDDADRDLVAAIEATGVRVAVTDAVMRGDADAERLARAALGLLPDRRR